MSIMHWNDKLSVGVNEIDNQHKAIINIINRLYDCVGSSQESEKVKELLPELYWYASEHFKHEELFMFETSYAQLEKHKQIHRDMLDEIKVMVENMDEELSSPSHMAEFFKNWLINHITVEDVAYAIHAEVLPGTR